VTAPPRFRRPGSLVLALGIAGLAFAAYLAFGPKPWESGVSAALEKGRTVRTHHHVVSGEWFGALVNLGLVVVLLAGARWIRRPLGPAFIPAAAGVAPGSRKSFLLAALAAVSLAGVLNAPRLTSSLWGDEEYTMKRMIVGDFERKDGGAAKLREVGWIETLWAYRNPNNHILNSILARASHTLLHRPSDAPDALHFTESAIRLPAFLAGLGSVAALGWCLACLGLPRAGIAAMFLLPFHPWFVRYGVDARGYAFVFLLFPLALGFLAKAARSGRWPHFLLFALAEFLLFYAYPGSLYLLVPLNLSGFLIIAFGEGDRAARTTLLIRLAVANIFAAMAVIQLMAPCLEPMRDYLGRDRARSEHGVDAAWIGDNLAYLASGTPWHAWDPANPLCRYLAERPAFQAWALLIGAAALVLGGIARLARHARLTLLVLPALLLPWPLFVGHSILGGRLMYHWYTVITLPGLLMVAAAGIDGLAALLARNRARPAPFLVAVAVPLIALFAVATAAQRTLLREHSVEPLRESVAATRSVLNPYHPDAEKEITVGFCMATRGYDPVAHYFKEDDPHRFEALIAEARASGRPLHVNLALPALGRVFFPKMMAVLENPDTFQELPPFHGLDPPCTRHLYRLLPASP